MARKAFGYASRDHGLHVLHASIHHISRMAIFFAPGDMAAVYQRKKVQPRAHPLSLPGEQMTGLTDAAPPPIPRPAAFQQKSP
jgi:hypothetical protein